MNQYPDQSENQNRGGHQTGEGIRALDARTLQRLIQESKEDDYLIVDVRGSEEFGRDHIPGSMNVPLEQVQGYGFDASQKLVFCCTRGVRCKVAAAFVADDGHNPDQLFFLKDGLFDYTGEILMVLPKIALFPTDLTPVEVMQTALNLEKGAYKFYSYASRRLAGDIRNASLCQLMAAMVEQETAHAGMIFKALEKIWAPGRDFRVYFDQCDGRVLEGGVPFDQALAVFDEAEPDLLARDLLDFSIELEYRAWDLYKTMASKKAIVDVSALFYRLAQAEKHHLDQLIAHAD